MQESSEVPEIPIREMGNLPVAHAVRSWFTLWLLWVGVTTGAFAVVVAAEIFAAYSVGLLLALPTVYLDVWVFNAVRFGTAGACGGAAFGFGQWLIVRRYGPRFWPWILASALPFGVAGAIGGLWATVMPGSVMNMALDSDSLIHKLGVDPVLAGRVGYPIIGAFLGFTEWLVLRRHLRPASWWIVANALAFTVVSLANRPLEQAVGEWSSLVIHWVLIGMITGLCLVWLVRLRLGAASSPQPAGASFPSRFEGL